MDEGVDVVGAELQRRVEIGQRLVELVDVGQRHAAVDEGDRVLGIELDRLAVVGDGVLEVVDRVIGRAALEIGEGQARRELDRLVEVGHRLLQVALLQVGRAASQIGPRLLGVDPHGHVEVVERALVVLLVDQRHAALIVGVRHLVGRPGELGILAALGLVDQAQEVRGLHALPDRLAEIGERLVDFAALAVGDAAVDQGVHLLRVELQRLVEIVDRRLVLALLGVVEDAAVDVGRRVLGRELDRLAVILERLVGLADAVIGDAALQMGEGLPRRQPQRLAEVGDRPVQLVLVQVGGTAADIARGVGGIDADGLAEIGDRLVVLLLVVIGEPALEMNEGRLQSEVVLLLRLRRELAGDGVGNQVQADRLDLGRQALDAVAEVGDGPVDLALALVDDAAVGPGGNLARLELERRRQVGDGALVVVLPEIEQDGAVDQRIGLARRQPDGVAVVQDGAVGLADRLIDHAALGVVVGMHRRAEDQLVEDADRRLVVVLRSRLAARPALRQSAIEIGECQVAGRELAVLDRIGAGRDLRRRVRAGEALAHVEGLGLGRLARLGLGLGLRVLAGRPQAQTRRRQPNRWRRRKQPPARPCPSNPALPSSHLPRPDSHSRFAVRRQSDKIFRLFKRREGANRQFR